MDHKQILQDCINGRTALVGTEMQSLLKRLEELEERSKRITALTDEEVKAFIDDQVAQLRDAERYRVIRKYPHIVWEEPEFFPPEKIDEAIDWYRKEHPGETGMYWQPTTTPGGTLTLSPFELKQPSDKHCQICDDTGDVHALDGNYIGRCYCPSAEAIYGKP